MFNYIYKHIFKDFGVGFPIQNKGTSKFKNGGIGEKKSRLLNVKGAQEPTQTHTHTHTYNYMSHEQ